MSDAPERQEIRFHAPFYDGDAVEDAVRAFADLATLSVTRNDNDTLVVVEKPAADVAEMICDELANYALMETIARARVLPTTASARAALSR